MTTIPRFLPAPGRAARRRNGRNRGLNVIRAVDRPTYTRRTCSAGSLPFRSVETYRVEQGK